MRTHQLSIPHQIGPELHLEWTRLLSSQHGVVEVRQLRAFAINSDAIIANLDARRWQSVAPRVYATFTGPLPLAARITASLLYAGPAAVLSHESAGELWGMVTGYVGPVHVTVPYSCSAISQPPLMVCHRSRAFAHIAVDGQPPLTSRADTAIDLAAAEPIARGAMARLSTLVTGRRVSATTVRRQLAIRPPYRYRKVMVQAMDRIDRGVESPLEELYAVDVEIAHGIPSATRQQPFRVDGRVLREDAVYDFLGVPLTVRLDGATHLEPDTARWDRRRDNAAELAGRSRLVYGWSELSGSPCTAAREVASVLHRYGWQGPFRCCPGCS
jgi:hypothetical protein